MLFDSLDACDSEQNENDVWECFAGGWDQQHNHQELVDVVGEVTHVVLVVLLFRCVLLCRRRLRRSGRRRSLGNLRPSRSSLSIAAEIDRDDHRHVEIDSVIFCLLLLHGVVVLVRLYLEQSLKS